MIQTQTSSKEFERTNYKHKEQMVNCGISSLKCMDGEDLTYGNRKRLQQLQQKDWIDQQLREKNMLKQQELDEKRAFERQTEEITKMRTHLEQTLLDKHRRWEINCKETNPQQMKEKFDNDRAKHDLEQEQNKYHINYCMTNNFQTENPVTCESSLAKHRVIPYHWKGMNRDQRTDIILHQDQQRKENEILKKLEQEKERAYAIQTEHNRFMLINLERHKNRQHKQNMNDMKEFNLQKAKEQKIKLKHMYD